MPHGVTCSILVKAYNPSLLMTRHVVMGISLVSLKQYLSAIKFFDAALSEDPTNYFALERRGWAYIGLRDYTEALKDFNSALEYKNDSIQALLGRAEVSRIQGDLSGARGDLNRVLKREPNNLFALERLGDIFRAERKFLFAKDVFYTAKQVKPLSRFGTQSYGATLYSLGFFNKAHSYLSESIRTNLNNHAVLEKRGKALMAMEQLSKAMGDFDSAVRIRPKFPEYWVARSECNFHLKNFKQAAEDAKNALKYLGGNAGEKKYALKAVAYDLLGDIFKAQEQYEDALNSYQNSLKLNPKDKNVENKYWLLKKDVVASRFKTKENTQPVPK